MRKLVLLVSLLLAAPSALAGSLSGSSALALAALVGERSPALGAQEKKALAHMLDGNLAFAFPPAKTFSVRADSVVCRANKADIAAHSCELTFGTRKISRTGRAAHALYATLIAAGAAPEGAAGTMITGISRLACTIDPNAVKATTGGGADCTFSTGQ